MTRSLVSRTIRFRAESHKAKTLLQPSGLIKAVGAHDALSAKLIEETGFDAIWASGFGIATSSKCIPDARFITLTAQLEVERNMVEAVSIPVIADCDTGYGNAVEPHGFTAVALHSKSPTFDELRAIAACGGVTQRAAREVESVRGRSGRMRIAEGWKEQFQLQGQA